MLTHAPMIKCRTDLPLGGEGRTFSVKFEHELADWKYVLVDPKAFMIAWQQDSIAEMGGHREFKRLQELYQTVTSHEQFAHLSPEFRSIECFDSDFKKMKLTRFQNGYSHEPATLGGQEGSIGFVNGRHRVRLLYACGIKQMPLHIEPSNTEKVLDRINRIAHCLEKGEPLPVSPLIAERFEGRQKAAETLFQQKCRAPEEYFIHTPDFLATNNNNTQNSDANPQQRDAADAALMFQYYYRSLGR